MNTVYMLIDPVTAEVRYVGITCQSLQRRYSTHLASARGKGRTYCCRWIKSLLAENALPIARAIEETMDRSREAFWIEHYRRAGARLTNLTGGGEGTPGYHHTEEARQRMSQIMAGKKRRPPSQEAIRRRSESLRGKKRTEEQCRRISDSKKGIRPSEETRQKMSRDRKGRRHSAETRQKISEAAKGREFSDQHKANIRRSRLLYLERQRREYAPDSAGAEAINVP